MEDLKTKVGELTDGLSEYAQTWYKLKVLNAADKATTITASTMASLIVVFLGTFVLLFFGIALSLWLGGLFNSPALGFLAVGGFFLLIIIIVVALRKRIVFPMIRNSLINKLYEPNHQNVQ